MDVLSVSAVLIGPLLILGVIGYTYVQANLENLRDNWVQYRCNPMYMPFAGGSNQKYQQSKTSSSA